MGLVTTRLDRTAIALEGGRTATTSTNCRGVRRLRGHDRRAENRCRDVDARAASGQGRTSHTLKAGTRPRHAAISRLRRVEHRVVSVSASRSARGERAQRHDRARTFACVRGVTRDGIRVGVGSQSDPRSGDRTGRRPRNGRAEARAQELQQPAGAPLDKGSVGRGCASRRHKRMIDDWPRSPTSNC